MCAAFHTLNAEIVTDIDLGRRYCCVKMSARICPSCSNCNFLWFTSVGPPWRQVIYVYGDGHSPVFARTCVRPGCDNLVDGVKRDEGGFCHVVSVALMTGSGKTRQENAGLHAERRARGTPFVLVLMAAVENGVD